MNWRAQGFRAWLLQRLTAIYVGVFIVWFAVAFSLDTPQSYDAWRAWLLNSPVAVATAVFFLAAFLHAWVGIRDVVIDYVHPFYVRFSVLTVVALALLGMALWVLRILLTAT